MNKITQTVLFRQALNNYAQKKGVTKAAIVMETSKIRQAREKSGVNRSELARRSGVPLRTLEEWEAGRRLPRDVYQLAKVARVLNCRIEDLITLEDAEA